MEKFILMKKLIIGGIALGLSVVPATAQQETESQNPLQQTRSAISSWVELKSDISKEATAWSTKKGLLEQRIELYETELENLTKEIAELQEKAETSAGDRSRLVQQQELLQRAQSAIEAELPKYETAILELARYFPAPLRDRVSTFTSSIPKDPSNTRLGVGQRMALIVGTMNEVDKFNNEATVVSEIRDIDGKRVQVRTLYLGLGQAFYANDQGTIGGVGYPAPDGWTWESKNEMAADIARAIGVSSNVIKPAEFVGLPLKITEVNALPNK